MINNSLIIGFGKRTRETIIPALQLISDEKILIYSRNFDKVKNRSKEFNITPIDEINHEILKNVKKIFIAVPCTELMKLINKISYFKPTWANLFIDTPIIPPKSNVKLKDYKNNFLNIFVSEDEYFNPIIQIIKKTILDHGLGEISKIEYHNSGYSYHTLAQSRNLLNCKFVKSGNKKKKDYYHFKINNTQISILGERNIDGYINILFKNSSLTINNKSREAAFKINYEMQDSVLSNYSMNSSIIDLGDDDAEDFIKLRKICLKYLLFDRIIQEKIISLTRLIKNTINNNDNNYYLDDGIYDSLVMTIVRKTRIYYDVLIKKKSLILMLFTKLSFLYISFFK